MNGTLRVLLADDDEVFVMLVRRVFEKVDGFEVELTSVCDGAVAMSYLRGEFPYEDREAHLRPHVVLLDERMNRMDGSEALAEIKADPAFADLPVCLLSTSDEGRLRSVCYTLGACFVVRKSLDYEVMKRKLLLLARFLFEVLEVQVTV